MTRAAALVEQEAARGKGGELARSGAVRRPVLRCMSEVEAEVVRYVWLPYIPAGKLTFLEGDPGEGKSFIVAALATALSLGRGLPGMGAFEPQRSVLLSVEDGLADSLRPRLDQMGADCSRILACEQALDLSSADGLALVREWTGRHRPALVAIDPVQGYIGGGVDMYRANETRAVLAPLAELAAEFDCAVLVVRHLSKGRSGRSLHAGLGSVDFTAAARSALLAGSAPDDRKRRALVHQKSNVGALGKAVGYSIGEEGFAWTGESALTAGDILAADGDRDERSAQAGAVDFLNNFLASGTRPYAEVLEAARAEGIPERTLRRAADAAGVHRLRQGFGGGTVWELPAPIPAKSPHSGQVETLAGMEELGRNGESEAAPAMTEPANAALALEA